MSQGRDYPQSDSSNAPEAPAFSAGASGVVLDEDHGAFSRGAVAASPTRGLVDHQHQPAMREVSAADAFEKSNAPVPPRAAEAAPSAFDSVEPEALPEDEYEADEAPADAVDPWGVSAKKDVPEEPLAADAVNEDEAVEEEADDQEIADDAQPPIVKRGGGVLTIPLICIGVAIIACVSLLPLADENHRLAWEREKLRADLAHLQEQVRVNDDFLQRVADDPTLAERLAQRQMKYLREGTQVLHLRGMGKVEMSPFQLVAVPPPPPMAPYQPVGGALATLIRTPRSQLYLSGAALLLIATGLVLGYVPRRAKGDDGD